MCFSDKTLVLMTIAKLTNLIKFPTYEKNISRTLLERTFYDYVDVTPL